jgi:hypothetical protein
MGCFFIWGSGSENVIVRMKGGSFSATISADASNRTDFKHTLRLLSFTNDGDKIGSLGSPGDFWDPMRGVQ